MPFFIAAFTIGLVGGLAWRFNRQRRVHHL